MKACVEEVEKRGLEDVGIYRVSGLSSEIQRMKKGFEKGMLLSIMMIMIAFHNTNELV